MKPSLIKISFRKNFSKMNTHQKAQQRLIWMYKIKIPSQLYIVSDDMNFLKKNVFNFLFAVKKKGKKMGKKSGEKIAKSSP